MRPAQISLIISTYEKPGALDQVLRGVQRQTEMPGEILLADDGSGAATRQLIEQWRQKLPAPVRHIWHEDLGFRKTIILNQALAAAAGDYIVLLDGDCVPHGQFIADHARLAERNFWVQGRRCFVAEKFAAEFSPGITPVFLWMLSGRITGLAKAVRLPFPIVRRNTGQRGIIGCNMGFWREDLLAVNGFDEEYTGWGIGEDSDVGTRLYNLGRPRKFVYGHALVYHLNHPMLGRAHVEASQQRLAETIASKKIRCVRGVDQYLAGGVPRMKTAWEPLRILHLNSLLTGGGTDDQCVKLAAELHRLGQEVWIAGPSGRRFAPVIAELGTPFFDTGPRANQLQFIRRAADFIRREKIQIVHGHHGRDLWPSVFAARMAGTKPKLVLTRHMAKSPSSWASRHFLLGQCDALIAVSEFVAKVLWEGVYEPHSPEAERRSRPPLHGNPAKIHVIPGGIDMARFHPAAAADKRRELGLKPEDYAFAVVGGFDLPRGKGQREFLAAAALLRDKIPRARFLIIGRGSMAELLQADIARLGLGGRAWLTGQVSDMPQVMNAIDCLVHPQIGTEALGLVVCEAHACGKPVIASALDGIPEAFAAGNYGRLVAPENVAELADAMASQAGKPGLPPGQAEEMHRRVGQVFSLEQMGAKVLGLYRDLLAADKPPPAP